MDLSYLSLSEDEDDVQVRMEDKSISSSHASLLAIQAAIQSSQPARKKSKIDHRTQPRCRRRKFRSHEAYHCIKRDFLGLPDDPQTPLHGAEFKVFFWISRQRFHVLMEDIMAKKIPFYQVKKNRMPHDQASLEAKLLLPLKCLAYGVPSHCFIDYFQMSKTYFLGLLQGVWQSHQVDLPGRILETAKPGRLEGNHKSSQGNSWSIFALSPLLESMVTVPSNFEEVEKEAGFIQDQ
jgi:hypothetical protein